MIHDMIRMILLPILFCVSRWSVKLSLCEEYFQTMDTDNSGKVTYASWLPQKRLENPYLPRAFLGISRPFAFSKFQSWIPFPTCDLQQMGFETFPTQIVHQAIGNWGMNRPRLDGQSSLGSQGRVCCWHAWWQWRCGSHATDAWRDMIEIWVFPKIKVPPNHPF